MQQTAWVKKNTGSLPSDRLRISQPHPPSQPNASKNKGKGKQEPPKSQAIKRLELLANGLKGSAAGKENDPKGGCFCQARVHPLSPYNPLCRSCGLILCHLNLPMHSCPSCSSSLFTPSALAALTSRLDADIAETLAKEDEARERAVDDARRAAGAFPTLSGGPGLGAPALGASPFAPRPAPPKETHKVLSLNAKTKKITVASYTSSPAGSRPVSRTGTPADDAEVGRIAAPPREVVHALRKMNAENPWEDLREGAVPVRYVPPAVDPPAEKGPSATKSGTRKKGKGKANAERGAGP